MNSLNRIFRWLCCIQRTRFSIRSILVVTAIFCIATVYFLPYFNDGRFVALLNQYKNKPVQEFVDFVRDNGRQFGTQWSSKRKLIGLTVHLLDGRQFEFAVSEDAPMSESFSINNLDLTNCSIIESNDDVIGGFVDY